MSSLSDDDIEKLFSGAPQYFARSESHFHGAPHPSVAFPFDEELEIRDLTDHVPIADRAWSGLTAWPHLSRDINRDAAAKTQAEERHKAHFHIRCRERPNMLSMQGLEKGTMGYQAALELSTADSLEEEQFGFQSVGTKARVIVDARERILSSHGWLRRLPESELLERLRRNGELYRSNDLRARPSTDTYQDLFHTLMRPYSTAIDKTDQYGLPNQIVALLKCLGTANVWIDLGRVEWRIRLGQVLWGDEADDELDDATAIHDADNASERAEEKYWLFMQILVATELLLRLDAITEGVEGRHGQRQVDGLIRFATNLMWPGIDRYEARISENARHAVDDGPTRRPRSTSTTAKQAAYPGAWDLACRHGENKQSAQTQRRKLAAALHESGWLTKSYVYGLAIPGEAMCHYLMATLLENDDEALAKLGPCANLSGGFVYAGKSFWSTACIVGRVLAAGEGAAECMGWISTDIVPRGMSDGWLGIEVQDVADDVAQLGKKARLWGKRKLERESSILGGAKEDSVLPADFIIPHENAYSTWPPGLVIKLLSLELSSPAESVPATPLSEIVATPVAETCGGAPEILSYPASAKFLVSVDGGSEEERTYRLAYDISFVTAHPCAPSHRVRMLKSPYSPTVQKIDVWGSDSLGKGSRSAYMTGHPLHKYFKYSVIHLSELIQKPRATLAEFLADACLGKAPNSRVLVVDCITNLGGGEAPQSPALERVSSWPPESSVAERKGSFSATAQMYLESQTRQFGSDMEVLYITYYLSHFQLSKQQINHSFILGCHAVPTTVEQSSKTMAPGKDMRRPDLIIPYQEPTASSDKADFSSTISSTMPMAAMFTRNKYVGWAAVVFSIQAWLGEGEDARKASSTPSYFSVLMSVMALGVTYMPLFLPQQTGLAGTSTEAPAPAPPPQ
ncbi:hypothetical protein HRG_004545 [Hirsutella rhossiliensis]|uniref:Uncharacterized protein n=1 Tax=Hirsutella rhossiliensis TaxID=111463 RepID=A0A9P8N013_9HYPO|nr:uncharacterized protein HRG_04545 [Hirsutella rhossiliensis]KAH0964117.1 hypothetical protein HRG_04545 [Hirsutella rhossiliensis]